MVKVSVVIPTYNSATTLPRAVYSVLTQTFPDIELIIVDDGSTDGTARTVDELVSAHPTIEVIRQENQGEATAANNGAERATGDYLAFLDHDDTLPLHSVAHRARYLAAHQEVDAVYGNSEHFSGGELQFRKSPPRVTNEQMARRLFTASLVPFSVKSLMYRRNAFRRLGGFDPRYQRALDLDIAYRLLTTMNVGHVQSTVYENTLDSHPCARRVRNRLKALSELWMIANQHTSGIEWLRIQYANTVIQSRKLCADIRFSYA